MQDLAFDLQSITQPRVEPLFLQTFLGHSRFYSTLLSSFYLDLSLNLVTFNSFSQNIFQVEVEQGYHAQRISRLRL